MRGGLSLLLISYALNTSGQNQGQVSLEAYDIYSAVLTQHYGSSFKQKAPVSIFSSTVLEPQGHSGGSCRAQAQKNPIGLSLLDKLLSEKQELRIDEKLRLPGPYKMVKGKLQSRENEEPGIFFCQRLNFRRPF
jgi:hypothetical protein